MSYNAEIQSNNADLQTILDKVNNLPEAGGTPQTCAVKIDLLGFGGSPFEAAFFTSPNGTEVYSLARDPIFDEDPETGETTAIYLLISGVSVGSQMFLTAFSGLLAGEIAFSCEGAEYTGEDEPLAEMGYMCYRFQLDADVTDVTIAIHEA